MTIFKKEKAIDVAERLQQVTEPPIAEPPILAALRLSERSQLERVRAENQKLAEIKEAISYFERDPVILERVARTAYEIMIVRSGVSAALPRKD